MKQQPCDLKKYFGKLAKRIPHETDGNHHFTFTPDNFPIAPSQLSTARLYLKKVNRSYVLEHSEYRIDCVAFHAHKETFRLLGLLILSKVFHPFEPDIKIVLTHPESVIKTLAISYQQPLLKNLSSGYHSIPYGFSYCPSQPDRYPFHQIGYEIPPSGLPCFGLGSEQNFHLSEDDYQKRDVVEIFGSDVGLVHFAELLLDAGSKETTENEYRLESESGYRGVGISSIEASLCLPGSLAWENHHWPEVVAS